MPLHRHVFCDTNPIPVTWACAELGLIDTSMPRLPLIPLDASGQDQVREALFKAELTARG
ncbi:dihydrodipicolinate synthase family protein [Oceanisphaera litoralis]|uniref:dihydrodipicolinate synthase family protein n=1 Tax=Oceanisphaera litoralis TaxID=225144 RepID=UPI003B82C901